MMSDQDEREDMKKDAAMDAGPNHEPRETIRKRPMRAPSSVQDPESGQERLRKLRCFNKVDEMVRTGRYARDVAYFIQEESGEMRDLEQRAVVYLVRRYKDRIFSDEHLDEEEPTENDSGLNVEDPFYALHLMVHKLQQIDGRINREVAIERSLNKLFSNTHKEYLTLQRLAMGVLDRQEKLGLLNVERGSGARQRIGSGQPGRLDVAQIASNPESRHRVIGFVEALMRNPGVMDEIAEEERGPKKPNIKRRRRRRKKKKKPDIKR